MRTPHTEEFQVFRSQEDTWTKESDSIQLTLLYLDPRLILK